MNNNIYNENEEQQNSNQQCLNMNYAQPKNKKNDIMKIFAIIGVIFVGIIILL